VAAAGAERRRAAERGVEGRELARGERRGLRRRQPRELQQVPPHHLAQRPWPGPR
jgi:hypothetical protein